MHNARVGGDFVLVTYAGGMNLYIGNNPDARGVFDVPPIVPTALADDPEEQRAVFAALAERARGRALAPSEVSAYWAERAIDFVREHPGAWLRLMARKLALSVNAYEPWNVRSLTLAREAATGLRLPLLGFGVIAPFAALGLWATRRERARLVPLYAWLATVWLTLWTFFVLARYRVAAVPVLVLFAAAGVAAAGAALRRRRARELAAVALALAGLALGVQWPIAREDLSIAWYNLANRYHERGEYERAIEGYARALRGMPGYLSAYNNLARSFEESGRRDEAIAAWRALLVLAQRQGSPQHVERAQRHLALARRRAGAAALRSAQGDSVRAAAARARSRMVVLSVRAGFSSSARAKARSACAGRPSRNNARPSSKCAFSRPGASATARSSAVAARSQSPRRACSAATSCHVLACSCSPSARSYSRSAASLSPRRSSPPASTTRQRGLSRPMLRSRSSPACSAPRSPDACARRSPTSVWSSAPRSRARQPRPSAQTAATRRGERAARSGSGSPRGRSRMRATRPSRSFQTAPSSTKWWRFTIEATSTARPPS